MKREREKIEEQKKKSCANPPMWFYRVASLDSTALPLTKFAFFEKRRLSFSLPINHGLTVKRCTVIMKSGSFPWVLEIASLFGRGAGVEASKKRGKEISGHGRRPPHST